MRDNVIEHVCIQAPQVFFSLSDQNCQIVGVPEHTRYHHLWASCSISASHANASELIVPVYLGCLCTTFVACCVCLFFVFVSTTAPPTLPASSFSVVPTPLTTWPSAPQPRVYPYHLPCILVITRRGAPHNRKKHIPAEGPVSCANDVREDPSCGPPRGWRGQVRTLTCFSFRYEINQLLIERCSCDAQKHGT